jgi:hypothetical protein
MYCKAITINTSDSSDENGQSTPCSLVFKPAQNKYQSSTFTENSFFRAVNEYHKFDRQQNVWTNKTFALSLLNEKVGQSRGGFSSQGDTYLRRSISNFSQAN